MALFYRESFFRARLLVYDGSIDVKDFFLFFYNVITTDKSNKEKALSVLVLLDAV